MGDSGSQVLGFALAALGLAASWKIAGATVTSLFLPILVLAVPILDTTLVTVIRLARGAPGHAGRAATTPRTGSSTPASPRSARSSSSR